MNAGLRWIGMIGLLFALIAGTNGQSCDVIVKEKQNNISTDGRCFPVDVITWTIGYTLDDNPDAAVSIRFDWDDGTVETFPATKGTGWSYFVTTAHLYNRDETKCLYEPSATLVVGGVLCTSTTQLQEVVIWNVDTKNGGRVSASPNVFPVCIGEGATMRFADNTRFNCVPPRENVERNESTRWIQWVYGTNHASGNFMSSDVSVNNHDGPWPLVGPVIELEDGAWGSDEVSWPITVADDNLLGEEFQVQLRYWNYCNPYPEGKPFVWDYSVIRIVDKPDPSIAPVDTLCQYDDPFTLSAATGGGTWSGAGIVDENTGLFSPFAAGAGDHMITYAVTNSSNCSAEDTVVISITPGPDAEITPAGPFCITDNPHTLLAATATGTWSGQGITDASAGIFRPDSAGAGFHQIAFETEPDAGGCVGRDTTTIQVRPLPSAQFLTPDSAWCDDGSNNSQLEVLFIGTDSSSYDLIYNFAGEAATLTDQPFDTLEIPVYNQAGINEYLLLGVREWIGDKVCEAALEDTLIFRVDTIPRALLGTQYGDICSPVEVNFEAPAGYKNYTWNFGGGEINTAAHQAKQIFNFNYADHLAIFGDDTVFTSNDSTYVVSLKVETFEGCVDSITETLTVYPDPIANFHVFPEVSYYPDSTVGLSNLTSVGNWSYFWDFGDGNQDVDKQPGTHPYLGFGDFDITLTAYNEHCRDSVTKTIRVLPPSPKALFEPTQAGCPPLTISFSNSTEYADTYIWDFDDDQFSTERNPTHTFVEAKEHHVQMIASGLTGVDTATRVITVYDRPQADFLSYPTESENLKQVFKFRNNSQKAEYCLWDFGDGTQSSDYNPVHVYEDSGTYTVSLVVLSEHNCPDTLVMHNYITVRAGEGDIAFPNAFAWNGSEPSGGHWTEGQIDNTVFHPHVVNVETFRMIIYTRWGEQIFETNDLYIGWDGYMKNGVLASEGVYLYKAWVRYVDGEEEILAGDITFLH